MRGRNFHAILFILILLSLSFLFKGNSFALHDLFKDIDENVDGSINEAEFSDEMKDRVFEKIDEDRSESISVQEWKDLVTGPDEAAHEELFQRIDKDRDRTITFFEFSHYADMHSNLHEAFMGLDKDGSNSLSPDEISLRPVFKMITIKLKF